MTKKQRLRKETALARLEAQLTSGVKTKLLQSTTNSILRWDIQNLLEDEGYPRDTQFVKFGKRIQITIPLTDSNRTRIKNEINVLNHKL